MIFKAIKIWLILVQADESVPWYSGHTCLYDFSYSYYHYINLLYIHHSPYAVNHGVKSLTGHFWTTS